MQGQYPLPALEGDRVSYRTKTESGVGTFVLCWMGIEEVWDVKRFDRSTIHLYPALGDTMQRVDQ